MLKKNVPRYILLGICAILPWQISPAINLGENKIVEKISAHEHEFVSFESKILEKINAERIAKNLPLLTTDERLIKTARQKSQDMINRHYFSHQNPEKDFVWKLMTKNGYRYQYAGENLARNFSAADRVISAWMKSDSHRKNILGNKFNDIGVGIEKDSNDHYYITVIFGKKRPGLLVE